MAVPVIVKGQTFLIPQRKERSWGDQVTDWAITISNAVSDLTVAGDIKLLSVAINNNQAASLDVPNLKFDTAQTRHSIIEISAYRIKGSEELSQVGHVLVTYKSSAGTWEITDNTAGDANISFTITAAGQVQYTTSNMVDAGIYSGKCSFRARAFPT